MISGIAARRNGGGAVWDARRSTATTTHSYNRSQMKRRKTEKDKQNDELRVLDHKANCSRMHVRASVCASAFVCAYGARPVRISQAGFACNGSRMSCCVARRAPLNSFILHTFEIRFAIDGRGASDEPKQKDERQIYLLCSDRHTYKLPT